jgi:hypothetical protein
MSEIFEKRVGGDLNATLEELWYIFGGNSSGFDERLSFGQLLSILDKFEGDDDALLVLTSYLFEHLPEKIKSKKRYLGFKSAWFEEGEKEPLDKIYSGIDLSTLDMCKLVLCNYLNLDDKSVTDLVQKR